MAQLLQDNNFKNKHDANQGNVGQLKRELDDLRFMLNEKNRSNNDAQTELSVNRDQVARKDMEINQSKGELAQKSD